MNRPLLREKTVNGIILFLLKILCKVDRREIEKLPLEGPYLLAVNHINFLDIPVLYLHLLPRNITGLVKKETWDIPLHGFLANVWHAIPIRRGVVDTEAMNLCEEYLKQGGILFVAPEGTRSGDGKLRPGKAGIVPLAVRSGVPVYPVAHFGGEHLSKSLKRLRRPTITLRVGSPFTLNPPEIPVSSKTRREIADLIMFRIAELLPPEYRGVYAGPPPEDSRNLLQNLKQTGEEEVV